MNDFRRLQSYSLDRATFMVVGVGASAGGFDAFQELLRSLDDSPDMAIIFVQHLQKDGDAHLSEVLSKSTSYNVVNISGRQKLKARTVYVCPPWTLIEMKNGSVRTVEKENTDRPNSPIDHFLQSLAEDQGERSIGVILSGTGSDGTLGLKAISDSGGLTFAQSLDSAKHDSMPRSAATTGLADHVLSPPEIATEIKRFAAYLVDTVEHQEQEDLQHIFDAIPVIAKKLLEVTNHNFQHYKQNTLARRIQRRMRILRLARVDAYVKFLDETVDEPHALFRELLISVTAFFRDPDAFEALTESVITPLFANRKSEDTVRIWVPGCATGEEAYTLAMLCREQMDKLQAAPEVQIFATDIDERALKISRQASYPIGVEEHISPERLERFFIKRGKKYQVAKEVRELVLFSAHNLISDPPFSRLDLISCRNLLIYLGPHLQQKLIPLFHYSLKSSGFLMLGPSENLSAHGDLFQMIDSKYRISLRKDTSVDATDALALENGKSGVGQMNRPVTSVSNTTDDLVQIMQRIVLDEFSPKSVIVEEDGKILCASADMHKYLTVGTGVFQNNIIKMARSGLRIGLRAALQEAKAKRRRIVHDNLSVPFEGKLQPVMLTVQPMPRVGQDEELFMVVFHDSGLPLEHDIKDAPSSGHFIAENKEEDRTQSIISQLERELSSTRDDLEKTVQEMETHNEELKASNEELHSMNEELQSVIEELASSKEEIKIASMAVGQANSDLENLLQNTRIATIFVDLNGIIRRFTQSAAEIYNLISGDIGRSLGDITHKLREMPQLPEQSVFSSAAEAIEHEVRSESGRWYLRRVLPNFRDAKIDGMILSFIDITDPKQAAIRCDSENRVNKIIASADSFDNAIPDILRAIRNSLNAKVCSLWLPNYKLQSLYCADICVDSVNPLLQGFVACSQAILFEPGKGLPGRVWTTGETHWIEDLSEDLNFSRLQTANNSGLISGIAFPIVVGSIIYGVVELFTDMRLERDQALLDMLHSVGSHIGQFILRRKLDEELREEEARKTSILDAAIDAIVTMDYEGRVVDFNPAAERTFGYAQDEVRGKRLGDLIIPEEYREAHALGLKRFLTTGHSKVVGRRLELTALRKDCSVFPVELAISATQTRDGTPFFTAHMRDITEHKNFLRKIVESEERLRNAAEAAGFGTVHADLISGKVHYSVEMKRLLGLDANADELIKAGDIPDWVHPEDRAACAQHFLESIQLPEGSSSKIDHRILRPDGEIRWIRLQAKPIYSQIGEHRRVTQFIGTILDITQQHEFEHSLSEARTIAEAANESKSAFLANMSHEIRTPMTAILGYTDLIADRIQDEQALSHLRTIRRNGYYLLDIINDILDLSKIEAGMLQIECEHFSPKVLVEDVRSIMDVRAKEKQLTLEIEYRGPIPKQIESDPKRLKQILINLLGNAIKFTEKGTVKLVVSYSEMMLKFEVIDTGIGMSKSQQKQLFQPFSQGDHTVNRRFGGTGLGLVISQRLAALLNGAITVKSESKKGSTFTVVVATGKVTDVEHVVSNSVGEPMDQAPQLVDIQLDCRILVVDDRRDIRFLSRRLLSEAGAKVTEAEDGEMAIIAVADALAIRQEFDLILLDMQMPKLDGYETAKRLRLRHYTGPIIALTADAMHGDMKRCLDCGCNNYLSKPIDRMLLLKMVRDYVPAKKS